MPSRPEPIVALDLPTFESARTIVSQLGARANFYKVGLQLFAAEGPRVVDWLHAEGKRVFLDLKLHDIPTTVRRAAESSRALDVALLTVHGLGGEQMVRAAVEGAGGETGILVVTILTSMDAAEAGAALGKPLRGLEEEVLRLAGMARASGAHGVVCGGAECAAVLADAGAPLRVLVPGIRLTGEGADDQVRMTTPSEASRAGAAYVVLGRAVTRATDPGAAYERAVAALS
ncbi:MAG TPA: orotidine-5'-phosphate decarboxylase [Gemmatimonadaceae bacterium]|nr:orotidine-5'-phosphate decarboxylase [Gemmatimonadaceae bacterium]